MLASLLFIATSSIAAEVTNEVSKVTNVSLSADVISATALVGGGCADHKLTFKAEIIDQRTVKIHAFDVASAEDSCRGIVYSTGTANIRQLITQALDEAGRSVLGFMDMDVELPKVHVRD